MSGHRTQTAELLSGNLRLSRLIAVCLCCLSAGFANSFASAAQSIVQPASAPDNTGDEQVRQIVDSLHQWTRSFHSIRIESRHSNRFRSGRRINLRRPPLPSIDESKAVHITSLWYENRFRFFSQSDLLEDNKLISRRIRAVDGFRFWIADSSPEDPLQFESITFMPLQPVAVPNINFSPVHPLQHQAFSRALDGIWQNTECCWMGEYLQRHEQITVIGTAVIDDHHCTMLRITPAHLTEASRQRNSVWWLDSDHGFLPIRKVSYDGAYSPDNLEDREKDVWEASELREVRADFWFPMRGTMKYDRFDEDTNQMRSFEEPWEISSISLDEPIPEALLQVPSPTRLTVSYINEFGKPGIEPEISVPSEPTAPMTPASRQAGPQSSLWPRIGMIVMPLIVLPLAALPIAALLVHRMRRRSRY